MGKNNEQSKERIVTQKEVNRRTILSFLVFAIFLGAAAWAWSWLYNTPKTAQGTQPQLRTVLDANGRLLSNFFSAGRMARTYHKSDAVSKVRVNGNIGMSEAGFDAADWKLKIARHPGDTLLLTLDDIKALPKTEVVFDFKCIEGWSQITYWGGVRVADVLMKYNLAPQMGMKYMGLITSDNKYYVGIDIPSILQPQTILCYEMNGKPLPMNQGYPLRLIIPVKYGIKHLKRIGVMYFSNDKPKDYWAEQGYDYYAGL